MSADPTPRTIVLGPRAHELRAHVGPMAWVVLEEMMQRSTGDDNHVVAQVSIRSLASSLGIAKDTVARAVCRLRDLGVIAAVQARSEAGVFRAGAYRLVLAVAEDRLGRAEQLAAPTRAPLDNLTLDNLTKIIDDHRRSDSIRRTLDRWNDLDGAAGQADRLCHALDRWNHWANGHDVSATEF